MDPKPAPERRKEGGLKDDKAVPPAKPAPDGGPSVSEETGEPERDAGKPGGMAGEG